MPAGAALVCALLACGPAAAPAADLLDGFGPPPAYGAPPGLRYFPRGDGADRSPRRLPPPPAPVACRPRAAPVPTDAPDDPSYVGSAYGLSKPSYYGFTPPLGVDDPYGRPLLPWCR